MDMRPTRKQPTNDTERFTNANASRPTDKLEGHRGLYGTTLVSMAEHFFIFVCICNLVLAG